MIPEEEFIGKLQMCYFGDRNAFDEIVEDNQKLKNEVVYSKVEIERLNNIIDELEKYLEEESKYDEYVDVFYREHMGYVLDKLKELKDSDNNVKKINTNNN